MGLWQIIKRELRQIFLEDPRRLAFLFGEADRIGSVDRNGGLQACLP